MVSILGKRFRDQKTNVFKCMESPRVVTRIYYMKITVVMGVRERYGVSVSSDVVDEEIVDLDYNQINDPDFTIQQKTLRSSITFLKILVRDGYQTMILWKL